ncbi:MAG TPA: zf-HC2 domain-containing protein, partial [Beijerinckiaceae bacterium]|nr:zf-HC2 domain-containing protein [Beijerinckiaceae bacterium]
MTCPDANEELSALLDGELPVEQTAALTRHLATCPNCAARLAELAQLRDALAQAIPVQEPSANLRARIEALLDAESGPSRVTNVLPFKPRGSVLRLAWIGGAVAVAATLAVVFLNPKDVSRDLMAVRDASLRGALSQVAASPPTGPT